MILDNFSAGHFPSFESSVRASWAPILITPIAGSYERLVVGVVVASVEDFHVEMANALGRLKCLYGDDAEIIQYAIEITQEHLLLDLSTRGINAIEEPKPLVSGIEIGPRRSAEGPSVAAIARNWMKQISSLYTIADAEVGVPDGADKAVFGESASDHLPTLVMDYVKEKNVKFYNYFNEDLRERRRPQPKGRSHEVLIDFGGTRLVANFETLRANRIGPSVNLIKRRLWDLKVERDKEYQSAFPRIHEMILQIPANDDPQVTDRQRVYLSDALKALEEQADQEELRLRSLSTVRDIGDHVLRVEAVRVAM